MAKKLKGPGEAVSPLVPGKTLENPKGSLPGFSPQSIPPILTVKQLSGLLQISEGHIRNLTAANRIPFYKGNGLGVRFLLKDIEIWLQQRRVEVKDQNYDFRR